MRTRIAITTVLTSIAVGAAAVPAGASPAASQPAAAHAAATRAEAKAAARKAVGGGRVTKVEHFNAGRVRWEIDVRRNGRSWEVKLSRTLRVLSKDLRHGGGDDDGPNHH